MSDDYSDLVRSAYKDIANRFANCMRELDSILSEAAILRARVSVSTRKNKISTARLSTTDNKGHRIIIHQHEGK